MEDKIKINDKTAWFAKELTLATMHEQFMEKFAIYCGNNKGEGWYGWKESDSPQKVWDWVEPRLQAIPIEPPVMLNFAEGEELKPIGEFIVTFNYTHKPIITDDGEYYHYADVCNMLKAIKNNSKISA